MKKNPLFESVRYFYFYLSFWAVLTVLYIILLYFGSQVALPLIIYDAFTFNILICGLGISFWNSIKYIPLEDSSLIKIFIGHFTAGLIASAVWLFLGYSILNFLLGNNADYQRFFFGSLQWRLLIGLFYYSMIILFYYIFIISKNLQEKTSKQKELQNLVTEAELRSLKFQINPHFIFNSLNSMSALTDIDPARAKTMIQKLADFLRFSLANSEKQKNLLAEEIKNIKLYLEIEKIRFGDKFEFKPEIDERVLQYHVPSMILQPLFENTIKHAVYESTDKVIINFICHKENQYLIINIENNFDPQTISKKGTGIGLKNIIERLKLIYNRDDLITINKSDSSFKVGIKIPIEEFVKS